MRSTTVAGAFGVVILLALIAWQSAGCVAKSELDVLQERGAEIEAAVLEYRTHHGRFPSEDEGWLVLELPEATLRDPTGALMRYASTAETFEVTAPGFPEWRLTVTAPASQ